MEERACSLLDILRLNERKVLLQHENLHFIWKFLRAIVDSDALSKCINNS